MLWSAVEGIDHSNVDDGYFRVLSCCTRLVVGSDLLGKALCLLSFKAYHPVRRTLSAIRYRYMVYKLLLSVLKLQRSTEEYI